MVKLIRQFRSEDFDQFRPLVFTNGCFDLLHVGHIRYLKNARDLGKSLFVGLNADLSVKQLKGEDRPVQSQDDRAEILCALESVNFVSIFEELTPEELIRKVKPDLLVKGGDWPVEKIVGATYVQGYGGRVLSLPYHPGKSTTSLVQKILRL